MRTPFPSLNLILAFTYILFGAGATRNPRIPSRNGPLGFNKSKNAALQNVHVQVSDALRSEGARFVGRTRTVRGVRRRVRVPSSEAGGDAEEDKDADEGDVEVFDDPDFYQ